MIQNHPFADGNKRTGHATMAAFLVVNDYKIRASVNEQVEVILSVASGKLDREGFTDWLSNHIQPFV